MSNHTVTVTIMDRDYQISCGEDQQQELKESAKKLDHTMREIRLSGKLIGLERIAVMAGLNLIHELIQQDQQDNGLEAAQQQRIRALNIKLDKAIAKHQRLAASQA
jgi:cell division protein ZapA